ncbi:MAG TPA: phage portal protein, partial [Ktedonobacteraceae bacterium]|nr:phage portal protein [Ktedonobacteraceae bacterium]
MVNPWFYLKERANALLYGPIPRATSTSLIPYERPQPPLKTSLVFESHILKEAALTRSKSPQTISSAWDERLQYGDTQRTWQGLTPQERKLIMLDIYLNNPWVSGCIDVITKRIFSGGYVVEKVDEEAPDNKEHEDMLHECALRINPDWDFNQLGRALLTDEFIFGECYAEMTWKNGLPWQIFKVDCPNMGFDADKYGQIERFYQEMQSTRRRNYLDPANIIRWWFPHPRASIDPFAPAEKVSDAILLDKKMMMWTETFFRKGTKFPFSVEGVGDQDEAQRFLAFFAQNFTGEKNAHMPFVTWGNAKLVWNAAQKLDMDFSAGLDRMRTIVFAAYGVPPAAVSIIESGNIGGGTGEDQDKSLIFNACDPAKSTFFEKLNYRVVQQGMGIKDYRYSARYAEYRSDESIAKVQDIRAKNGTRTIDELRQEDGKRPYKTGGDVPYIWSSKEITPVPRLGDLEEEQRQTAAATLQSAQAQADLAQTKAKQAKEPPPEPTPPALLQKGQQSVTQKATDEPEQKQKQESRGNTGAMVALMIPPEIGRQIAIAGGEPVEDLHITLAFLGEAFDIAAQVPVLKQVLQIFASTNQPLSGRIAGIGQFDAPEGQPTPIIALPDIPGLPEFRQALAGLLMHCGTPANAEHGYTPHITLMYVDPGQPTGTRMLSNQLRIQPLDLHFDAICLCVGDERTYFPLLGQKTESEECNDEVMSQRAEHIRAEIAAGHCGEGGFGMEAAELKYFTGKTELPQWTDPDEEEMLANLAKQGVVSLTWEEGPNPCKMCLMNRGVTVKLGDPFPSGHRTPLVHPNCDCGVKHGYQAQEEDKDAT